MLEKEKIEQAKPANEKSLKKNEGAKSEIFKDQTGRYRFYYDNKPTKNHPELLSERELEEAKKDFLEWEEILPEDKKEDLKTPEIIKEIEKIKRWISNFGEKIGISNLEKNLTDTNNIYVFPKNIYEKYRSNPYSLGYLYLNEIFIKEDGLHSNYFDIQHELLHSACIESIYFEKELNEEYEFEDVRSGYGSFKEDGKLHFFNEGLTNITNLQICFENKDASLNNIDIGYTNEIILVSELAKNISLKIKEKAIEIAQGGSKKRIEEFIEIIPQHTNGHQREKTKEDLENVAKNLTEEETFAHLQRGMFRGERKYLKIISDIYGREAFNALANMTHDKKNIIEIARLFGLDEVENKIENKENSREIEIDMGNYLCALIKNKKTKGYLIKSVKNGKQ